MLDKCPNVSKLSIAAATSNQLKHLNNYTNKNITYLDISFIINPPSSVECITKLRLKAKFPNLKCLIAAIIHVPYHDEFNDEQQSILNETFKQFLNSIPKTLTHINLSGRVTSPNHLIQLCQYFNKNLIYLDVSLPDRPYGHSPEIHLSTIFEICPNIVYLDLSTWRIRDPQYYIGDSPTNRANPY